MNASLVSGLDYPIAIAITPVPEPSTIAGLIGAVRLRQGLPAGHGSGMQEGEGGPIRGLLGLRL